MQYVQNFKHESREREREREKKLPLKIDFQIHKNFYTPSSLE